MLPEYTLTEKGIALGRAVAYWVDKKIKRVSWTNEQIDKWFGRRSVKEIIRSEETCFMNPCLDLTLVSSYIMTQNKIKNEFVIEEHLPTGNFNFNRLHFALDFTDETGKYFLNYEQKNIVHIVKGRYLKREDIPQAWLIKIPGTSINPDKAPSENLMKIIQKEFKNFSGGYSLEKHLQRLKQDNTEANYRNYQQRFGENLILIS